MPSRFLKSEHVLIKRYRLLQIFHPVAGVQQFLDHRVSYCPLNRLNSNSSSMKLVIAATGASGSIYLQRLLDQIDPAAHKIHLVMSGHAKQVAKQELGAIMLPAIPSFYSRPVSVVDVVDTVVWRILDQIGLPSSRAYRWADETSRRGPRKKP